MADTSVDFFLDTLNQLIMSSKLDLIIQRKVQLQSLEKDLRELRQFLKRTEKIRYEHPQVKELVTRVRDAAYEAEKLVELFVVAAFMAAAGEAGHPHPSSDDLSLDLESVNQEIEVLTTEVNQIYKEKMYGISDEENASNSEGGGGSSKGKHIPEGEGKSMVAAVENPVVVGFDDEVTRLIGRLDNVDEGGEVVEIISIVGAAGVGKTTLARKVFEDEFTAQCFNVRAWVTVSQKYEKKDLLIEVLESAKLIEPGDNELHEIKLGEVVLNRLKGKKYLLVMDDIWSTQAWDEIKNSFLSRSTVAGSKVIFTSREGGVQKKAQPNTQPHSLQPLSEKWSWELLRTKVFGEEECPKGLEHIGKKIAEQCRGLPLEIVVVAGVLKRVEIGVVAGLKKREHKTLEVWNQVSKSISQIISRNKEVDMEILALSYYHLPLHLKACFVYLGAFPEDYEIPIRKLTWLWIAEGFIKEKKEKTLENVAEDYLMDLVDRNLITVARKRCHGGIKACRIHDLLRVLCLRIAGEESFLHQIYEYEQNPYSSFSVSPPLSSIIAANKHRRLYINRQIFHQISLKPYARNLHSLLCFGFEKTPYWMFRAYTSFFDNGFKLLRVLDMISISISWGSEIEQLVHLRYLALWTLIRRLPPGITNLWNLETLVLGTIDTVILPIDIWKMEKLRHLYTKKGIYHIQRLPPRQAARIGIDPSSKLDSLQTMFRICPCQSCLDFLKRTPNLKKLGVCGDLISGSGNLAFPDLTFLEHLETLKYVNTSDHLRRPSKAVKINFPDSITRLTLQNTVLEWEELSILESLPNLEILKLLDHACVGKVWKITNKKAFCKLKYLRFQKLDMVEWTYPSQYDYDEETSLSDEEEYDISERVFPKLEVLLFEECQKLEKFPSDFADLPELRTIEVNWCSQPIKEFAKMIKQQKEDAGGDVVFHVVIRPSDSNAVHPDEVGVDYE